MFCGGGPDPRRGSKSAVTPARLARLLFALARLARSRLLFALTKLIAGSSALMYIKMTRLTRLLGSGSQ